MRNLFILFCGAAAFMTFTASNCKKREPIELAGSRNNPRLVGLPVGMIRVNVRANSASGADVQGAKVNVALSADSLLKKQFIYTEKISNDSGRVNYDNLQLGKTYYFTSVYTIPGTKDQLKTDDVLLPNNAKANPVQLPSDITLVVQ